MTTIDDALTINDTTIDDDVVDGILWDAYDPANKGQVIVPLVETALDGTPLSIGCDLPKLLMSVDVPFDYEAYFSPNADVAAALSRVESNILLYIAAAAGLVDSDSGAVLDGDCTVMYNEIIAVPNKMSYILKVESAPIDRLDTQNGELCVLWQYHMYIYTTYPVN